MSDPKDDTIIASVKDKKNNLNTKASPQLTWSESASENGDETWNEIAISRKTWSAMNGVWIHDERLCLQRA